MDAPPVCGRYYSLPPSSLQTTASLCPRSLFLTILHQKVSRCSMRRRGSITKSVLAWPARKSCVTRWRTFDGAICRSGVKIKSDSFSEKGRLRAIVRAGVGTDNIDKSAATRAGVVVMNTPAGNTLSTAEHTITLMLALSRNVAPAFQGLREGRWDRKKYMGAQVAGKTLGLVGLGRIGLAVAPPARTVRWR